MRRSHLLRTLSAAVLLGGCVIYENHGDEVAPGCRAKASVQDGERCNCTTDCITAPRGATCLTEFDTGLPGGFCYHPCSADADCGAGFGCTAGSCQPSCENTAECEPGRVCEALDSRSTCTFLCDEDTDCDDGECNLYSSECGTKGRDGGAGGLDVVCSANTECRSKQCVDGTCISRCDPEQQRCPDGGFCIDGLCLVSCTTAADCAGLGTTNCTTVNGASVCFWSDL